MTTPEVLQAALVGIGSMVGSSVITALWLKKAFGAIDEIPRLLSSVATLKAELDKVTEGIRRDLGAEISEGARTARAAHGRIDLHSERLAKLEARADARDRESERTQREVGQRLERIEDKLDTVIAGGGSR